MSAAHAAVNDRAPASAAIETMKKLRGDRCFIFGPGVCAFASGVEGGWIISSYPKAARKVFGLHSTSRGKSGPIGSNNFRGKLEIDSVCLCELWFFEHAGTRHAPTNEVSADPNVSPSAATVSLQELVEDLLPAGALDSGMNSALPAVYNELRDLAAGYLRHERSDHTLQPTALVHESYLRLLHQHSVDWTNRLQFLSIAARMMRRILSDHAQARAAHKRGGGAPKLQLDSALEFCDQRAISIAAVDQALRDLETMDARQAQVVELRFFGGLTIAETAELMALSEATVKTGMEHSASLAAARDRRVPLRVNCDS